MYITIPVYRKKIDLETGLPILDENGQEISEHIRDTIVYEDIIEVTQSDLSPDELKEIEINKQRDLEFLQQIQNLIENP
jgi:hypothetical protein